MSVLAFALFCNDRVGRHRYGQMTSGYPSQNSPPQWRKRKGQGVNPGPESTPVQAVCLRKLRRLLTIEACPNRSPFARPRRRARPAS